jgi:hypothetical protein
LSKSLGFRGKTRNKVKIFPVAWRVRMIAKYERRLV